MESSLDILAGQSHTQDGMEEERLRDQVAQLNGRLGGETSLEPDEKARIREELRGTLRKLEGIQANGK